MPTQMDNLIALVAVSVGLAGTVAVWLLGILGGEWLRLARLNPTRYRRTHSNGARRLQLAAR